MFTTPRLRLRAITRADLPTFVRWMNDPEVSQYLLGPWPLSMEDEEEWFQNVRKRSQWERPLGIEVPGEDSWILIGNVHFQIIEWRHRWAQLGIVIGEKDYWNRGYGTETVQAMVAIAFSVLDLNRVQLEVFSFNPRAQRAYEKAGLRVEGCRREAIYLAGRHHDSLIMAVLRHEWQPPDWWTPAPGAKDIGS